MRFAFLSPLLALATLVAAHPGQHHGFVRKSDELIAHELMARKCAGAIAEFEHQRRVAREAKHPYLARRQTPTTTAPTPHYTTIQNSTCVTAVELTEGPYYIRNEYIRYDLRETQGGVTLVLDVGVIDTTTCRPFPNAFVELWAVNATGFYGGYSPGGNVHTDTFLRGGQFTNENGIVELTTLYPGYYTGRTSHIHAMIHKNAQRNANGTIASGSGQVNHIGQFFFDESWNDRVFSAAPYTNTREIRMYNNQDWILWQGGASAFVNTQPLGAALSDGLLGYITVAVDGSKNYRIMNTNVM
ncbi:hypothetical protein NLJ89_g5101 [Agrocybe chaxingu]|uniref:Intradiol ring-cleavage dioxygenases domain-containing protein n=1 Tax=Agrocybe chaxingu TaxID=84603 RepID=A0A9W8K1X2_9AGAR|nr:hypothetical protein NLJ89_g5101 [Agrocybe chaxingu]